jgi:hypothetical protein
VFDGGDWSSLYRYVFNSPIMWIDPNGKIACADKVRNNCKSAAVTNNPAEWCFCHVAGAICEYFTKPVVDVGTKLFLNCLSSCMYNHWARKDTPYWKQAEGCPCKGLANSEECCVASVATEQKSLSDCEKECKHWGKFPPLFSAAGFPFTASTQDQVVPAFTICCEGGFPGTPPMHFPGMPPSNYPSPEG